MSEKLKKSIEAGNHKILQDLTGKWKGTAEIYFEPGKVGNKAEIEGEFDKLFDGRFIKHKYKTFVDNNSENGEMLIGFNNILDCWEFTWVDTFHTGTSIMFGQSIKNSQIIDLISKYSDPAGGPDWGWRTIFNFENQDKLNIKMYNITPKGVEDLAVNIYYTR